MKKMLESAWISFGVPHQKGCLILAVIIIFGLVAVPAQSAVVFYTDKAAWQAASTGLTTINFEGIAPPGGVANFPIFPGLPISGAWFLSTRVAPFCEQPFPPPGCVPPNINIPRVPFLQIVDPTFNSALFDWNSGAVLAGGPVVRIESSFFVSGIQITLPPDVTSVGVDFMSTDPNDRGFALDVFTASEHEVFRGTSFSRPNRAFIGITSDLPISRIVYGTGGTVGAQALLDNFTFGTAVGAEPPDIPGPSVIAALHRSSPSSPHAARGGADPVDLATGSYVLQGQDVTIPTRGLPLAFARTYHSAVAGIAGPLGFGWTHSYNMAVFPDATGALVVRMPDGRLDRYVNNGGTFAPPPGIYNRLAINPDGTFMLMTKERDTYTFDASGRLVSLSDTNGNTTALGYTGNLLTSIVAPDSRLLMLSYDATGRIIVVTDPLGREMTYAYDASGNLVSVTDPLDGLTAFTYDAAHRLTSVTDPQGNSTIRSTYDDEGRVIEQRDAAGHVTTLVYTPGETVETDPLGRVRRYRFDSALRIVSTVDPAGSGLVYEYDAAGNLASFTDELGHATHFTWDERGNVTSITDALGHTANFAYDVADNMLTATDPLGNRTTFAYDAQSNLTRATDPLGRSTALAYDSFGQIGSATDANSHAIRFAYDSQGNTSAIIDALGNRHTLAYDAAGRLLHITDPLGHSTAYSYDALDRLVAVEDALGQISRATFDANGKPTSIIDGNGVVTSYTYDALNRLTRGIDGLGGTVTYNYDAVGNLLSFTDANGHITQYRYDARDRLTRVIDSLGNMTALAYDAAGRLLHITDPLGHATAYSYDALDRLVAVEDALGHISHFAFDSNSNLTSTTDANGVVTAYTYDVLNRLTQVVDAGGGTVAYSYDTVGNLTSRTDANGHSTRYAYDALDRLSQLIDPLGGTTGFAYDAAGRLIRVTDPFGHATSYTYDALDRLSAVENPLGHISRFAYDANSNLSSETDVNGIVTSYSYDTVNRLTQVVDAGGGTVAYSYDTVGNLTSRTDANGHSTRYAYDALDRLSQVIDPLGRSTSYGYDAASTLISRTDARGHVTRYTYDPQQRLVRTEYTDSTTVDYTYDTLGNVLSMADSTGTTLFVYDALSRLTDVTDPLGRLVSYTYDPADNRTSMTYPDGRDVRYAYDANDRLTSVTDWLGKTTAYTYDTSGRLLQTRHANGVVVTNTLDAADRLLAVANVSAKGKVLAKTRYELDAVGNRLSSTDARRHVTRYTYDHLYRLTRVQPQDGPATMYEYDAVGNRVRLTRGGKSITYTYDAADQLITAGSLLFTFDANGNQTGCGDDRFAYDEENRLVRVEAGRGKRSCRDLARMLRLSSDDEDEDEDEEGSISTYTYNGAGLRVAQSVMRFDDDDDSPHLRTTTYVWDLAAVLPVILDDDENRYVYGLDLLTAVNSKNKVQTYLYDGLGSVVAVAKANGDAGTPLGYDAFGARVGGTAAPGGFGFIGQQTDATGLLYLRARYYDPITGRFLTTDPFPDLSLTSNLYSYALNNPVAFVDLDGAAPFFSVTQQAARANPRVAGVQPSLNRGGTRPAPTRGGGFLQTAATAARVVTQSLVRSFPAVAELGKVIQAKVKPGGEPGYGPISASGPPRFYYEKRTPTALLDPHQFRVVTQVEGGKILQTSFGVGPSDPYAIPRNIITGYRVGSSTRIPFGGLIGAVAGSVVGVPSQLNINRGLYAQPPRSGNLIERTQINRTEAKLILGSVAAARNALLPTYQLPLRTCFNPMCFLQAGVSTQPIPRTQRTSGFTLGAPVPFGFPPGRFVPPPVPLGLSELQTRRVTTPTSGRSDIFDTLSSRAQNTIRPPSVTSGGAPALRRGGFNPGAQLSEAVSGLTSRASSRGSLGK